MKKYIMSLILIIVIIVGAYIFRCVKENEKVGNAHMNVVDGKVIKIMDENKILVEITRGTGEYKTGQKLLVKFKYMKSPFWNHVNLSKYEIQMGDVVVVQFDIPEKLDGYDYVETDEIGLLVDEKETQEEITTVEAD